MTVRGRTYVAMGDKAGVRFLFSVAGQPMRYVMDTFESMYDGDKWRIIQLYYDEASYVTFLSGRKMKVTGRRPIGPQKAAKTRAKRKL